MTVHLNRQVRGALDEGRRPTFPLDRQSGSLFLGWGPKL
jgi:hypothetical protein